jgi:hypothetical protein
MPLFVVNSLTPSAIVQIIFLAGQLFLVGFILYLRYKDRQVDDRLCESMETA